MHNNYYFLRQLTKNLNQQITGFRLVSCFSQNKDELIIEFNNSKESFFIKASLQPNFSCLSFPKSYHRARKNSIDLFNEILMKKVEDIHQFDNERSFAIQLSDTFDLLFKMHGNMSNIILFHNGIAIAIFKNQYTADLNCMLSDFERTIDWSREEFDKHKEELSPLYFTFGKLTWTYLKSHHFFELNPEEQWLVIQTLKTKLEKPTYFLINYNGELKFSLFEFGQVISKYSEPIEAINEFFLRFTQWSVIESEKSTIKKQVHDKIKAGENYIEKNKKKLNELLNDHHYQLWGDLIMANMHELKTGQEKVILTNFFTQEPVEIKLKREFNPQKNAEVFYRKAKNQQIEINKLKEAISEKEIQIKGWKTTIAELDSENELKEIRKTKDSINQVSKTTKKISPYHEFEFKGFKIWVGKNAEANDELTLKYSYKEDLWLHAKDVPGSHVLIKYQSGKKFPKDVIERAAQLAAYNSKRKTETLCPVTVTPKKFVRKRKGDPAGMVVVEKEETILVEPNL